MAFSTWEGNYIWLHGNKVLSSLVIFIAPWYMPLLFVLAGMSAKYAMNRRSHGQFAVERIKKLLVPLLAGTISVVAIMTYFADKFHNNYKGNFLEHYKVFFTNITDLSGYDGKLTPAHLWFVLYLFIISMLSILIIMLQKKFLPKLSFKNTRAFILPLLLFIPLVMTPILNFGGKSIGGDFALFMLGYYVISEDQVLEKIAKYRHIYFAIMLVSDIILTYLFVWKEQHTGLTVSICNPIAAWFGILTFLGIGKCSFNQCNKLTKYFSSRSFLIYIFHFGWLVVIQYYLNKADLNTAVFFILSISITLILTLLTCEIVRTIPGVRTLFGVKKKKIQ